MARPNLQIDVLPSWNGKVYYLPLGAKVKGAKERLKVCVRLQITHQDSAHSNLTIKGVTFTFPGTSLPAREMKREKEYISPSPQLAFGDTATWSNGSVELADDSRYYNQIYLDTPAPPKLKIKIECDGFTEPATKTFDLIPFVDPTGNGPLYLPFAESDLYPEEHVVTSAVHWYNGGANGTQIFAHDITIQARVNGEWTTTYTGEASDNEDIRNFGRSIRAMGKGEVFKVEDLWDDNPYGGEIPETDPRYGSNNVWVRYGNIEVNYRHLKAGSVVVAAGDLVDVGDKLAEAGSSGNTSGSPHLHMECRVAFTETICPFVFKGAWMIDRAMLPVNGGDGFPVQLLAHGICEETAALKPFGNDPRGKSRPEFEVLVAKLFGGVAQDGEGFVIINGKLVRVPPRGIRAELLKTLIDLDSAVGLNKGDSARAITRIAANVDRIATDLKSGKR